MRLPGASPYGPRFSTTLGSPTHVLQRSGVSADLFSVEPEHHESSTSLPLEPVDNPSRFGLPGLDSFEQHLNQADLDRDPFAIALFEVMPVGNDYSSLLPRLARCLLDFASLSTHVAHLGNGRLALLTRTNDTTHRWVAPVGTALRSTLDEWLEEVGSDDRPWRTGDQGRQGPIIADLVGSVDISELAEQPRLVSGAARGLTRQVWLNAEAALAKAHRRQLSFVEHRWTDVEPPAIPERTQAIAATATKFDRRTAAEKSGDGRVTGSADDDRLVIMSHRLEPVDRPEPEWVWLRLEPGLQPLSHDIARVIDRSSLRAAEQAMLEVWLANQIGPLFAEASTQLRLTIPITAEAARARSFAQRIFPILERHRIPPSRLVLEVDDAALAADQASDHVSDDEMVINATQPSVRRFVEDAAAMDVAVVVSNFRGGWASWRSIDGLPIRYVKPLPELVHHAGAEDDGAIRALVLIGADAESRGVELIVPDVETELSAHALAQIGFAYHEGPASAIDRPVAPPGTASAAQAAGSRPTAS